MKLYGLIGFPLGHSFSARYFADKFQQEGISDCLYRNFPLERIEQLPILLEQEKELCGFNVTIPHKQAVQDYLSALSEEAREIGAVNCVQITPKGLVGYNTDAYGFRTSLLGLLGEVRPARALVLGTGGASRAVRYVLAQLGIAVQLVSRHQTDQTITYSALTPSLVKEFRLIVNATPVGTFPHCSDAPALPYEAIRAEHFLFDLVYNPSETEFLKRGAAQGASVRNGYEMLVGQAEKAWEIWNRK